MRPLKRKALFVGIDEYANGITALSCACNDAGDLHDFFDRHGYDVKIHRNGRTDEILNAIKNQLKDLTPKDMFLFFFAGHGYTISGKNGELDRCLAGQTDFPDRIMEGRDGISLREVKRLVEKHAKCACVVIIDACQTKVGGDRALGDSVDEPCTSRDLLAISQVVNSVPENDAAAPFVVINSCAEGEVAYELKGASHGLFTSAMLDTLQGITGENGAGDPAFDQTFVDMVSSRMGELCGSLQQHPTLIVPTGRADEILPIFPISPEFDMNVRKWLAGFDSARHLELKHFAEDAMAGRASFKYAPLLRNLLRLASRPESPLPVDAGAVLLEAFHELKGFLDAPERPLRGEPSAFRVSEEMHVADGGGRLRPADRELLSDVEARLRSAEGDDVDLSDIEMMSQADAAAKLDEVARKRMRTHCGGGRCAALFSQNERAAWSVRARKGFSSVFESAVFELVRDDKALSQRRQ